MSQKTSLTIEGIEKLELVVRRVVSGKQLGIHQSPHRGSSVEFAEHRPYEPGDEFRDIDWKLFARTDRLYVKQYEEYQNLNALIILDGTASMDFESKMDTARLTSATLIHLLIGQGDGVGLNIIGENGARLPLRQGPAHRPRLLKTLLETEPAGRGKVHPALRGVLNSSSTIDMVLIVSDFLEESPEKFNSLLKQADARGIDLVLFQILSASELALPGERPVEFHDPESSDQLRTVPRQIREDYQKEIRDFINSLKSTAQSHRYDHLLVPTDEPEVALGEYLIRRHRRRGSTV